MSRRVRGALFLDYVRMIRSRKDVDWSHYLAPGDEGYLKTRIVPDYWYPMDAFGRLGMGILKEIAGGDTAMVRSWGRLSVDDLLVLHPHLLIDADPQGTLRQFAEHRSTFFDFNAIQIKSLSDRQCTLILCYYMEPQVEEAAAYQTLGFCDRLLERSGATGMSADFASRAWRGDGHTTAILRWTPPGA